MTEFHYFIIGNDMGAKSKKIAAELLKLLVAGDEIISAVPTPDGVHYIVGPSVKYGD